MRRSGAWPFVTASGCGSKVTATGMAASRRAVWSRTRKTCWCPRCTPSKTPTVTASRVSSGSRSMPRRIAILRLRGLRQDEHLVRVQAAVPHVGHGQELSACHRRPARGRPRGRQRPSRARAPARPGRAPAPHRSVRPRRTSGTSFRPTSMGSSSAALRPAASSSRTWSSGWASSSRKGPLAVRVRAPR